MFIPLYAFKIATVKLDDRPEIIEAVGVAHLLSEFNVDLTPSEGAELLLKKKFKYPTEGESFEDLKTWFAEVWESLWIGVAFQNPKDESESLQMIRDLESQIQIQESFDLGDPRKQNLMSDDSDTIVLASWVTQTNLPNRQEMLSLYKAAGFDTSFTYTNTEGLQCAMIYKEIPKL